MGKWSCFVFGPLALIFFVVIGPLVLMWLWNSTAGVVFPRAVEHNWLAGSIGWWTAFKVLIMAAILFGSGAAATRSAK
jgi:hypothetical protein